MELLKYGALDIILPSGEYLQHSSATRFEIAIEVRVKVSDEV
jgi:hypothetical protein